MRIAVSGAGGLIGHTVANHLGAVHQIVAIGRRSGAHIRADFTDPAKVSAIDLSGIDALIHCAGITDEDFAAAPGPAFLHATLGMAALVSRAVAGGVRRFAYVSSAHVYGPLTGHIDEASPANPLSDYAIAHYASEQILRRSVGRGLAALVLRPCAVFGIPPDIRSFRRWALVPFDFPLLAMRQGAIVIRSSGRQRRNFVGTGDIARCLERWLRAEAPPAFDIVNPLGRETLSILDLAHLCADIAQRQFGRTCEVVAGDDQGPETAPLDYASRDVHNSGTCDLAASLAGLMAQLAG